jgi:hypothetical protein
MAVFSVAANTRVAAKPWEVRTHLAVLYKACSLLPILTWTASLFYCPLRATRTVLQQRPLPTVSLDLSTAVELVPFDAVEPVSIFDFLLVRCLLTRCYSTSYHDSIPRTRSLERCASRHGRGLRGARAVDAVVPSLSCLVICLVIVEKSLNYPLFSVNEKNTAVIDELYAEVKRLKHQLKRQTATVSNNSRPHP